MSAGASKSDGLFLPAAQVVWAAQDAVVAGEGGPPSDCGMPVEESWVCLALVRAPVAGVCVLSCSRSHVEHFT